MTDAVTPDVDTASGLEAVLAITRSAAREAAAFAFEGFRKNPIVEHKGVVDLVTSFDTGSELVLRRRLSDALPSFAIVGEELSDQNDALAFAKSSAAFYVDPIDGTTNFVHGHPFWCVSVGLVVRGLPVLGVVIAPALGLEMFGWVASSGQTRAIARRATNQILRMDDDDDDDDRACARQERPREEPCTVSRTNTLENAFLATGFPYDRRTSVENNFDAFVAIKKKCQGVRRCGSAALDLCLVADGTYDGYWEMKLSPWDSAAGIAIVRAAGGRVTDYEGGARFIETGKVIATNGSVQIHEALMNELRKLRSPTPTEDR